VTITCVRCGRDGDTANPGLVPDGWEGSILDAVCPGCQLSSWNPHCTSVLDREGVRVAWTDADGNPVVSPAISAMPREEWATRSWTHCDYVDSEVVRLNEDPAWEKSPDPLKWTCPRCGGTSFEWVHADYPASGLQPGSFTVEADDDGTT
jgi:hypothetical protein